MGNCSCPLYAGGGINAASSVHLNWDGARGEVKAIKVQCKVLQSAAGSYFSLIGFNGGYIGVQDVETSAGRFPRCIFSLWDRAGNPSARYVGADVRVERFSGEGEGMKMMDDTFGWTVGVPVSCVVVQVPSGSGRLYGGFVNNGTGWKHIGSIHVDGADAFGGFYSFVEDFKRDGGFANEVRAGGFDDVWLMCRAHRWYPATGCTFTQSTAPNESLETVDSQPFTQSGRTLETGGNLAGQSKIGQYFHLSPGEGGRPREGVNLPDFPSDFQRGISDSVLGMCTS